MWLDSSSIYELSLFKKKNSKNFKFVQNYIHPRNYKTNKLRPKYRNVAMQTRDD